MIIVSQSSLWHPQVFSARATTVANEGTTWLSSTWVSSRIVVSRVGLCSAHPHYQCTLFSKTHVTSSVCFTSVTLTAVRLTWSRLELTIFAAIALIWVIVWIHSWITIKIPMTTSSTTIRSAFRAMIINVWWTSACKMIETQLTGLSF